MSAKAKNKLTPQQRKATLNRVLHKIRPYSAFVVCSLLVAAVSVAAQLYIPILCGDASDKMLGKGNCWDNAPTESFWGRLKTASVHGQKFATRAQARRAVMDWMAFYNHRRLHSTLDYLSPMQYEQRWYEAQRKKAA